MHFFLSLQAALADGLFLSCCLLVDSCTVLSLMWTHLLGFFPPVIKDPALGGWSRWYSSTLQFFSKQKEFLLNFRVETRNLSHIQWYECEFQSKDLTQTADLFLNNIDQSLQKIFLGVLSRGRGYRWIYKCWSTFVNHLSLLIILCLEVSLLKFRKGGQPLLIER